MFDMAAPGAHVRFNKLGYWGEMAVAVGGGIAVGVCGGPATGATACGVFTGFVEKRWRDAETAALTYRMNQVEKRENAQQTWRNVAIVAIASFAAFSAAHSIVCAINPISFDCRKWTMLERGAGVVSVFGLLGFLYQFVRKKT